MVPKGICHLCGEQKGLTYEHVPARSSYNEQPAEMFGLESWLRQSPTGEMTGGALMEQGAGAYTLCYSHIAFVAVGENDARLIVMPSTR